MADSPSLSFTDHLPTKVDVITKGSQAPNIDRDIRVAHANKYPLQVWYFLASLIFLITLFNFAGLVLGYYRDRRNRRRLSRASRSPEAQNLPNMMRSSINLLRLPHALVDTFRAISFRWTISIGRSYTLNLAEVVFTAIYISICFAWTLINSECALIFGRTIKFLTQPLSNLDRGPQVWSHLLCKYCRKYRLDTASPYCGIRNEEQHYFMWVLLRSLYIEPGYSRIRIRFNRGRLR